MTDQNNSSIANSPDPAADRRQQLAALIPEAFSEGQLDLAALRRALGGEAIIEGGERYALTWAGKGNAYKVLQTPSSATLRPQRELSVNFDEAQHVFIEGENLEVLKVLQKAYFGKVKLIYIDPPYNTGSDSFIYPDRFQESKEDYLRRINDLADDGTLMREGFFRKNSKESGHYHSNWLSMMLPRLYIARNLLREDGVIFVSCDDNEVHNLRCLMNEVFGEENFIGVFAINASPSAIDYGHIAKMHDYAIFYARNIDETTTNQLTEESKEFKYSDDIAPFNIYPLYNGNVAFNPTTRKNLYYPFYLNPNNKIGEDFYEISLESQPGWVEVYPVVSRKEGIQRVWRWGKPKSFLGLNKEIIGYKTEDGEYRIVQKSRHTGKVIRSLLLDNEVSSRRGTGDFEALFNAKIFSFPKPVELIKRFIKIGTETDSLVLDFFSGSGTTAQAVIEANLEDGGDRKFVLVQLPEQTENTEYPTIADIARERVRRVIARTKQASDLVTAEAKGLGFKSFILSPSNFKQWRGDGIDTPEQLAEQMQMFAKSEKDGSVVEHILYELLLKFGQELTTPVEILDVASGKVFSIHQRKMLFILDTFTEAMIQPMVDMKPREIIVIDGVFRDSDPLKSNLDLQCRDAGIKFTCL